MRIESSRPGTQIQSRLRALAASEAHLQPPQEKLRDAFLRAEWRSVNKVVDWVRLAGMAQGTAGEIHRAPTVLLLKPVGDRCNLACTYCYEALRQADLDTTRVMPSSEMQQTIAKVLAPPSAISEIYLHGGEPLLAGKRFFREFVAAVRAAPDGRGVKLGVQTNGVLIDDEWASMFVQESVKVGISLDGDPIINDMHRLGLDGRSSYKQAQRGIEVLQKFGIAFGVISVFTNDVACIPGAAGRILRHMSKLGISEFDLHPAFTPEETSGSASRHNVQAHSYARFMSSAFDEWLGFVEKKPLVRTFEDFFLALSGVSSDVCHRSGQCMSIAGVNENGDVQPCTRPFHPRYSFGNLTRAAKFTDIVDARGFAAFENAEAAGQASTAHCKWRAFCGNGGCPHERFLDEEQDPQGRHVFCTCDSRAEGGFPALYEHMTARILSLTDEVQVAAVKGSNDYVPAPPHQSA